MTTTEKIRGAEMAEAPADAFGAGYVDYQARTIFRDMCRIYGFEGAREKMAFIMIAEASKGDRLHG